MNFKIETQQNTQVLQLQQLHNPEDNQLILQAVADLLTQNKIQWIIDLSQLNYINSTGLNVLIGILTRVRARSGEVVLIGLSDNIKQVLILTRLQTLFTIKNKQEEAVNFFKSLIL